MVANKATVLLLLAALTVPAKAQSGHKAETQHRRAPHENAALALVRDAETAIEKKDYQTAESKLKQAAAADPTDYRAWFDLGFVYSSTDRRTQAIESYRKSVDLKPDSFESNLNLGVVLAAAGDSDAEKYLHAATKLKPATSKPEEGQARAWIALAMFLEGKDPNEAVRCYRAASLLLPKDPEPHLAAAMVMEKQEDYGSAANEFETAARLDPTSRQALAGVANVYMRLKRFAEAEQALRHYIAVDPRNVNAHLQLGRVLRELGRSEPAAAEFNAAAKLDPDDMTVQREIAASEAAAQHYAEAEARYGLLVQRQPNDAEIRYALGAVLVKEKKFLPAQQELLAAAKLKPSMSEIYGDLAVAAAENKNYDLAIRALDQRARFLPEIPATFFLRATAYDNLHAYAEAADFYRKFLEASAGRSPDQEWQARHRLIAIEPEAKKKKK